MAQDGILRRNIKSVLTYSDFDGLYRLKALTRNAAISGLRHCLRRSDMSTLLVYATDFIALLSSDLIGWNIEGHSYRAVN